MRKKNFSLSLIISFIFIVLGLFLFIRPDSTITTISYIIGCLLLIIGALSIIRYFRSDYGINALDFDLVYGVLLVIGGIYLIIKPTMLASIFPVVLGIWIIINSVTKFQYALILKKLDKNDWKYTLLISFLTFAWGIILLINPFQSVLLITQVIGIFIIIYAVLDIIDSFILKRNEEDLNKMYILKK